MRRTLVRVIIGFAGLIVVILVALLVDHLAPTALPETSGQFAVGRTMRIWKDAQQNALLAPLADTPRELVGWIWYPAEAQSSGVARADYFPDSWRAAVEQKRGALISKVLTRDLAKVHVNSFQDAAVARVGQPYPLVFIRPGAAAFTLEYSALAEDLASHGYIVVGFDAPYRTALVVLPDGRVVQRDAQNDVDAVRGVEQRARAQRLVTAWSADVGFVIDQLEHMNSAATGEALHGTMDLQRIGILGHSLGGAVAAHFCSVDSRCKAGADLDGDLQGSVAEAGIGRPFMFIMGDHEAVSPDDARIIAEIDEVFVKLPPSGRNRVRMIGANHFSFSDDGALLKSPLIRRVLGWVGDVGLTGRRQIGATAYCVRMFFDAHLRDLSPRPVKIENASWPELREIPDVHMAR